MGGSILATAFEILGFLDLLQLNWPLKSCEAGAVATGGLDFVIVITGLNFASLCNGIFFVHLKCEGSYTCKGHLLRSQRPGPLLMPSEHGSKNITDRGT